MVQLILLCSIMPSFYSLGKMTQCIRKLFLFTYTVMTVDSVVRIAQYVPHLFSLIFNIHFCF